MFDRELVIEQLTLLEEASRRAISHASAISKYEDFVKGDDDRLKLDATAFVLIGIGEQIKSIEKRVPAGFFAAHPEVNWKQAKAMRDRISHDYFGINAKIVFKTVKTDIPLLLAAAVGLRARLEAELENGAT